MDVKNVYVGEISKIYRKNGKIVGKKVEYKKIYYNKDNNTYYVFNNNNFYPLKNDGKSAKTNVEIYLNKSSLVSLSSFYNTDKNLDYSEISYRCDLQIRKMIKEKCKKLYGYKYTDEEIDEIHSNNKLTIDEKADEILREHICVNSECCNYQTCIECVYNYLSNTKKRSFDKFGMIKKLQLK